jgi:Proteasome assembly chaperone 4
MDVLVVVANSIISLRMRHSPLVPIHIAPHLIMGPLMVALPRTNYQGAFSEESPSSSKLIPSEDMESELLASPMAARLSQQLQRAVLVSCHFDDAALPDGVGGPLERRMFKRHAATLAEQRIGQILPAPSGVGTGQSGTTRKIE